MARSAAFILAIFSTLAPNASAAFTNGSPVCDVLPSFANIVSHVPDIRLPSPGNYGITFDATHYIAGESIGVTLAGGTFSGFAIEAVDETGVRIGTWISNSGAAQANTNCGGAGLTHTTLSSSNTVTGIFTPPLDTTGPIFFEAYVYESSVGPGTFYRLVRDDGSAPSLEAAGTAVPGLAPLAAASALLFTAGLGVRAVARRRAGRT